jgi:hypothetical protein
MSPPPLPRLQGRLIDWEGPRPTGHVGCTHIACMGCNNIAYVYKSKVIIFVLLVGLQPVENTIGALKLGHLNLYLLKNYRLLWTPTFSCP